MPCGQGPGDRVGELVDLCGGAGSVQARIDVDPLRPAGHGHTLQAQSLEHAPDQQRHLRALPEPHALARIQVDDQPVGGGRPTR